MVFWVKSFWARTKLFLGITLVISIFGALSSNVALAESWQKPVEGSVSRDFRYGSDPFAANQHRGVDFEGAPGAVVKSACFGRVTFAGEAFGVGKVISVRCGKWHVSYLPLQDISVAAKHDISRGDTIGRVGKSIDEHDGLHVGVRLESSRFGYVDPMQFFGDGRRLLPPSVSPLLPRNSRYLPEQRPVRFGSHKALRRIDTTSAPALLGAPSKVTANLPRPVWIGLALFLFGFAGLTTRKVRNQLKGSKQRNRRPKTDVVTQNL